METGGFFFDIARGDLAELLEIKLTEVRVPPVTGCPGDMNSRSSPPAVHQLQLGRLTLALVPAEVTWVNGDVLCPPVCLCKLGGSGVP